MGCAEATHCINIIFGTAFSMKPIQRKHGLRNLNSMLQPPCGWRTIHANGLTPQVRLLNAAREASVEAKGDEHA